MGLENIRFEYIKTNDFRNEKNAQLWDKVSLLDEEKYVIDALRIIEPNIEKLNFLKDDSISRRVSTRGDDRIPFVTLKESFKRYRLSGMGDGINRILTIILALVNCKNGVFLLDEFENGLHYSVQTDLWKMIKLLSEKLNIQVFVTSHSNDCIASFAKIFDETGQLIRLEKRENGLQSVIYTDQEDIQFALSQDLEIR